MLSLVIGRYMSVFNLSSKYSSIQFILIYFWWLTKLFNFIYDLRVCILSPNGWGLKKKGNKLKIILGPLPYVLEIKSGYKAKSNKNGLLF